MNLTVTLSPHIAHFLNSVPSCTNRYPFSAIDLTSFSGTVFERAFGSISNVAQQFFTYMFHTGAGGGEKPNKGGDKSGKPDGKGQTDEPNAKRRREEREEGDLTEEELLQLVSRMASDTNTVRVPPGPPYGTFSNDGATWAPDKRGGNLDYADLEGQLALLFPKGVDPTQVWNPFQSGLAFDDHSGAFNSQTIGGRRDRDLRDALKDQRSHEVWAPNRHVQSPQDLEDLFELQNKLDQEIVDLEMTISKKPHNFHALKGHLEYLNNRARQVAEAIAEQLTGPKAEVPPPPEPQINLPSNHDPLQVSDGMIADLLNSPNLDGINGLCEEVEFLGRLIEKYRTEARIANEELEKLTDNPSLGDDEAMSLKIAELANKCMDLNLKIGRLDRRIQETPLLVAKMIKTLQLSESVKRHEAKVSLLTLVLAPRSSNHQSYKDYANELKRRLNDFIKSTRDHNEALEIAREIELSITKGESSTLPAPLSAEEDIAQFPLASAIWGVLSSNSPGLPVDLELMSLPTDQLADLFLLTLQTLGASHQVTKNVWAAVKKQINDKMFFKVLLEKLLVGDNLLLFKTIILSFKPEDLERRLKDDSFSRELMIKFFITASRAFDRKHPMFQMIFNVMIEKIKEVYNLRGISFEGYNLPMIESLVASLLKQTVSLRNTDLLLMVVDELIKHQELLTEKMKALLVIYAIKENNLAYDEIVLLIRKIKPSDVAFIDILRAAYMLNQNLYVRIRTEFNCIRLDEQMKMQYPELKAYENPYSTPISPELRNFLL